MSESNFCVPRLFTDSLCPTFQPPDNGITVSSSKKDRTSTTLECRLFCLSRYDQFDCAFPSGEVQKSQLYFF